jgi:DNA-binding TFAR19-related protein (PDSD5 family)
MAELVARERRLQETKEKNEKILAERERVLKRFLDPEATSYLQGLKTSEPAVGNRVQDIILYLIVNRGLRQIITQTDVRYIERQIKGEEPTIRVQRDGEISDFGSYVREAIKENGRDSQSG